jgi:uncharacterized protein
VSEYLAPGVYVEETSFRPKTIEGVSTSTAGFVGTARFGPIGGEPELLTSFADFERIYGGLEPLNHIARPDAGDADPTDVTEVSNFLAHGVRAFFEEGGRRCYVGRVYEDAGIETGSPPEDQNGRAIVDNVGTDPSTELSPPLPAPLARVTLRARFPGRAGNLRITFIPRLSGDLLALDPVRNEVQIRSVQENDTVLFFDPALDEGTSTLDVMDVVREGDDLVLSGSAGTRAFDELMSPDEADQPGKPRVYRLTVDVVVERPTLLPGRAGEQYGGGTPEVIEDFLFHPASRRALTEYFVAVPTTRRRRLTVPFEIMADASIDTGHELVENLLGAAVLAAWQQSLDNQDRRPNLSPPLPPAEIRVDRLQRQYRLRDGHDGFRPGADRYRGDSTGTERSGLAVLEEIEDISIVAVPGYSHGYATGGDQGRILTIQAHLINHCETMRYRVAVLDAPDHAAISDVRAFRGKIDSKYAALYYPWLTIMDPISDRELNLPPSGFIAGIYARNDVERGVQKAPANEVVRLAVGFETTLNKAQQDVLNPDGINCLRFFEGRGNRVWGARTVSSDGEWKYINVRRYFVYLERSIDKGTQVFVFESNDDRLWENVRRTVEDFLLNEWKSGRLMGLSPEEAYFVRCDRTTMTQNDIDNGRLICLVGVAPLRPAEFVIFRIGQKLINLNA